MVLEFYWNHTSRAPAHHGGSRVHCGSGLQPLEWRTSAGSYRSLVLMNSHHARIRTEHRSAWALLMCALLSPGLARSQCQPIASNAAATPRANSQSQPQFFDEPRFTVAGVTDASSLGGHGSDSIWRTKQTLAREAAALNTSKEGAANVPTSPPRVPSREAAQLDADAGDYERARAEALAELAREDRPDVHHLLGNIEEKLGNPLEAVQQYQRAAELDPSEANLFDWGAELLLHHAPEPAVEVFSRGNQLFPHSTRMLVALGIAWYSRGSYDRASECLCQASDVNPDDPNPYVFLGKIQAAETSSSKEVAERLERFAKLQPENALANYYYAVSLSKQQQSTQDKDTLAKVESLLQKAVHLDPKLAAAHLHLGILYAEQNRLPNAISEYEKAIEVDPELEAAHYRLAQAYRQTGNKLKAQQELRRFEQLSKEADLQADRERHEVQQFVYTLQGRTSSTRPQ